MTTSGELLYSEDYEAHPLFYMFFVAVIVLVTYLSLSPFNARLLRGVQALLILVVLLLIFLYFSLRTMRIRVTERELSVAFGVIGSDIPLFEVLHVKAEKPSFWRYGGGLGIRWGWDGSVGYLMNYGDAVRVVRSRGRAVLFSTRSPDEVVAVIKDRLKDR
jgi:hypothetical protein